MEELTLAERTDRYLDVSAKLDDRDLDWAEARRIGLDAAEVFILTYFSDIEHQTIVYLRDLLKTEAALEPDVVAFSTMWNYEEFFHGKSLARLLKECGHPLEERRIAHVRRRARLTEWLEAAAAALVSRIFRKEFPAVYMAWGAVQEFTTLHGYEAIAQRTRNPVLRTLCERIAKQERRHLAWYFNSARDRLGVSRPAQRLTRFLIQRFWTPVGAGVKTPDEVARLLGALFPGDRCRRLAQEVDAKFGKLPGMDGVSIMTPYFDRARRNFPEYFALRAPGHA